MEFKDYYRIMGLTREASPEQIKRAYRKLARKYHPDVSKEPNSEEKFKELGEAYEVLKDPEKRAAYDRIATGRRHGERFTPPPDWDLAFEFGRDGFTGRDTTGFSDFFESLFGRAGPASRPYREWTEPLQGQDRYAPLALTLEEAYAGKRRTITVEIPEIGPEGRMATRTRKVNVTIPGGVRKGQRIRLAGLGSPGARGGQHGDLYLEIQFKPHRLFRVEGGDVYLDLPLAPWEAALGAKITVPTLAGKVDLQVPPNSQGGQKLRLKGRGLPGHPPGDQFATLRIVLPEAVTTEARKLYQTMAELMPMNPRASLEER